MKTTSGKPFILKLLLPGLTTLLLILTAFVSPPSKQIDSDLLFSTYLGGELTDKGTAMAVDQAGNVYITGSTQSTSFPAPLSSSAADHGVDIFVAKISPNGDSIAYILWFDATSAAYEDEGLGISVDDTGHAYVAGYTRSPDFCSLFGQVPGYDTTYNDNSDAFLLKVKPDGSGLVYCTFLGGNDWDAATAVIVDESGSATITGETWSNDFPTTLNAFNQQNNGLRDAFVATIDASGTELKYSTYVGGDKQEKGSALVIVGQHEVAFTGWTNSEDFPITTGSFDPSYNGAFDAFLVRLDLQSGLLTYGSFLGGDGEDRATDLDVLNNGQLLVTGYVEATDDSPYPLFPTTSGAIGETLQGNTDAFVTKFNSQGSELAYSTLLGGSGSEQSQGISASAEGGFAVTGQTTSADFPITAQGFQTSYIGVGDAPDAYITQFNESGSHLIYSSYLGGDQEDKSSSVFLSTVDHVYLTGSTRSTNFPTSPAALNPNNAGDYDVFVTSLTINPLIVYQLQLPLVLRD